MHISKLLSDRHPCARYSSIRSRGAPGVVFILNVTDIGAVQTMLEALPLGQAHLMNFELYPIGPLNPLRQLLKSPRITSSDG